MTSVTAPHSTPDALADVLARGMAELGVAATPAQRAQLHAYLDLLEKWNKTYNLTAIRDRERMVTHHLLDALAVLPQLPQTATLRVLDVGSGGGIRACRSRFSGRTGR